MKLVRCCRTIGTAILFFHALWAQTSPGANSKSSLTGSVRDPAGAAIAGAHITLKDQTGAVQDKRTDKEGVYRFSLLSAGHYSLNIESKGFEPKSGKLDVNGQEALTMNFVLSISTQRQSVTVTDRLDRMIDYTPSATNSTAMKTDTPVLLTPQSVQTVPQAVLLDQNALLLSDATRNVAGVAQDFGFNGGTQPSLILRGFPSNFSMVAGGGSGMTGMGTYYMDGTKLVGVPLNMADAQQVDVVKGPDTVLYGRAEPGGLVNVVTAPLLPVFNVDLEEIASQWGSTRSTGKIGGRLNRSGSLLFRASGTWFADKTGRAFVRDRLGSGSLTLNWKATPRTVLGLTLNYQHQAYRNDFGIPAVGDRPANLPYNTQFNNAPDLSKAQPLSARLNLEQTIASGWLLNVRLDGMVSNTHEVDIWPYRYDILSGAPCFPSECLSYFYDRPYGRDRLVHGTADLTGKIKTGPIQHSVLVGLDGYANSRNGTLYLEDLNYAINIYNPVYITQPALDPSQSIAGPTNDKIRWVGLYGQDMITLPHRLIIVAGFRADWTSAIYGPPGLTPNIQSFVKPRVGLVWQFTDGQSVYAQYQQALGTNNGRSPITGVALAPEIANQYEFGYKVRSRGGAMTATVAAYQLVKNNLADYSLYPNVTTIGQARSRGLEVDVRGRLTRHLSSIASYAYTDAVITKDPTYQGERLPEVPRNSGSLWLHDSLGENWTAGAGVFAQGLRNGDYGSDFALPGYARFDAMVSRRFQTGSWHNTIQFNVLNLTDKRYYPASHPIVEDWIQVGLARTYEITLRLNR